MILSCLSQDALFRITAEVCSLHTFSESGVLSACFLLHDTMIKINQSNQWCCRVSVLTLWQRSRSPPCCVSPAETWPQICWIILTSGHVTPWHGAQSHDPVLECIKVCQSHFSWKFMLIHSVRVCSLNVCLKNQQMHWGLMGAGVLSGTF